MRKKGAKQFMTLLLILILVLGMMPISAFATSTVAHEGEHEWADWYSSDGDNHYIQCLKDDCDEKKDYAACVGSDDLWAICTVCGNRMEHTCYNSAATCLYGGICEGCGYGAPKNPDNHVEPSAYQNDENTHRIVCDCGLVYIESEPHTFPDKWDDVEGTDLEERWCGKCLYTQTRMKQSDLDTELIPVSLKYEDEENGVTIAFTPEVGEKFSVDAKFSVKEIEPTMEHVALNSNEYLDGFDASRFKLSGSEIGSDAFKVCTDLSTVEISENKTYDVF